MSNSHALPICTNSSSVQPLRRWQLKKAKQEYIADHPDSELLQKEANLYVKREATRASFLQARDNVKSKFVFELQNLTEELERIKTKMENIHIQIAQDCEPIETASSLSDSLIENDLNLILRTKRENKKMYNRHIELVKKELFKPFGELTSHNYIPDNMLLALLPYQVESVNRIIDCYVNMKQYYPTEVYTSVVGNRVGSGKTRISLLVAYCLTLFQQRHVNIIVPGTLIHQYEYEIQKLHEICPSVFPGVHVIKTVRDVRDKLPQKITIVNARYIINYLEVPNRHFRPFTIVDEIPTMETLMRYKQLSHLSLHYDLVLSATWKQEKSDQYDEFYFEASSDFIDRSYSPAKVIDNVIECSGLTDKVLAAELGPEIIRLLKTGNTKDAIKLIGGDSLARTFEDAVTWKFNTLIKIHKKRITTIMTQYIRRKDILAKNDQRKRIQELGQDETIIAEEKDEAQDETQDEAQDEAQDEETSLDVDEDVEEEIENDESVDDAFIRVMKEYDSASLNDTKRELIDSHLTTIKIHEEQKENVLTRVRATNCPICLSSNATDRVVTNCEHAFCHDCIDGWIKRVNKPICPLCKTFPFTYTVLHNEASVGKPSKRKAIQRLFEDSPKDTFILFSESDQTFEIDLEGLGIEYKIHRGHSAQMNKAVEDLKNGKIRVLCVNTQRSGCGLNLGFVDQIIKYHKSNSIYEEIQTIGRANRLGRTKDIIVNTLTTT